MSGIGRIAKKPVFLFVYLLLRVLCAFLYHRKASNIPKESVKKILTSGYNMGIGNMILFTPAITAIRRHFPKASITLLVGNNRGCEEVVSGSALVDDIINFEPAQATIIQRLRFIKRLRDGRFDLLISNFLEPNLHVSLLAVLANIPYRIGHVTSPGWRNRWDWAYNFKVAMAEDEHEIDRNLRLAYAAGVTRNKDDIHPVMWLEASDREYANNFLKQSSISDNDLIIGVQAGSAVQQWKRWNPNKYAELCDKLVENYGAKIVLLGSANELDLTNYVAQQMKYNSIVAAGSTTLKQAGAIIERCRLVVCNDSGLMHVSGAVGTSVIAIYGPTDYHRTYPYGNCHIMVRKALPCSPCYRMGGPENVLNCLNRECLNLISVEDVLSAVERQLSKRIKV